MNRTLIVAAVATLVSGTALAQSSVTVYGRLNLSVERQDNAGSKSTALQNNASRLGFKGSEDLGGGLRAGFVLEHGFDADTGTPDARGFWRRQSEVNLSGGFGTLRLGTFTSEAYYATSDYVGMHNHETGTSSDALYAYVGRDTNKIGYRAPEFVTGLTLDAAMSLNESSAANARSYDFAANYQLGNLHLGLGYEKFGTAKQTAVSALYEVGPVILGAMVQRDKDAYGPGNRTNVRGAVAYIFGLHELHLNVGVADDYSKLSDSGARQTTVGYNYNLSKRTKMYAFYTKVDAERFTPYAGDFSSLAAGVRHNF